MESFPDLPDEHALVIPDAWRRQLHQRRGGLAATPPTAPQADDGLTLELRSEIETVLRDAQSDPEVADRGLAHLRGSVNPAGAAAVATALAVIREARPSRFAERWIAEHGIAFAACAVAELSTLAADRDRHGWHGVRYARVTDSFPTWWASVAYQVRTGLAAASDDEYQQTVERLAHCRRTALQRVAVCYLVPTRQEWVDECCANPPGAAEWSVFRNPWMLLCALGSPAQVGLLGGRLSLGRQERSVGVVATLVEGVGAAAVSLLAEALDDSQARSDARRLLLDALALLPADEAFQAMLSRLDQKYVQPATLAAMRRFPVRGLRLLAEASRGMSKPATLAAELLRGHVRTNAELTAALLPELPAEARTVVESIVADAARVPEAPAEALPPVLVTPPWTRARKAAKPVVVQGLTPPGERRVDWAPGERDTWRQAPAAYWRHRDGDWETLIERYHAGQLWPYHQPGLFVDGPEELVRPLLAGWNPDWWNAAGWMQQIVARFELDAFPLALAAARANPAVNGGVLLPFLDTEAARLAAGWLMRLKSARKHALAWFGRHGTAAVPRLLPTALGKAGADRRSAEGALRLLASRHGAEEVVTAARAWGDDAAGAVETLLAADPLEVLPPRMPQVGDWADPAALPQVLLRDRSAALPTVATGHLLTILAISPPDQVYAGLDIVRRLCHPGSLAAFGRAVFERWQGAGAPSKDGWALTQLGLLGDDETVRRLTPVIRAWPGEGGHSKAVTGLNVLAAIGTDVALMHLHGIAQKAKFKGLKSRAQEKIQEVADQLELTPEQLADRLVPDFGLAADGSMTLDYGPRRFVVGFDEQLKPYVTDENGKRRANLPKPGAKDDPELGPAAYQRFAALKKDVRTVAADQIRRLEAAMVRRRRWSPAEFGDFFVTHPLLLHIARRLVWAAEDDGRTTAFRIAEDRTFADVADDVLTLPDSVRIGLTHPLDLGDDLKAWAEVFADYEILQPFPQLGRAVHRLAEAEAAEGRLARFEGVTLPVGKVLGLERRGWQRGVPQDAGVERWISKELPDGRYVVIDLDPGIAVGVIDALPEQKLEVVWLADWPGDYWPSRGTRHRFGELDPVTASEVLADLVELTGAATE